MESRRCGYLFLLISSSVGFAGEINLSGIFSGFGGTPLSEQRKVEERIEQDLAKFHSVSSARVLIPMGEVANNESIWGNPEPRMLTVEVILNLKKRKRLTRNEFLGITNMVSSGLSEGNRVVQVTIRDEDGYEWSEDNPETQSYFKAAATEGEILDRLNTQWGKDVNWTQVSVSQTDSACNITGKYGRGGAQIPVQVRREVMNLLQGLCSSARLNITPIVAQAESSDDSFLLDWLERAAFAMVGFAAYGLYFSWRKLRQPIAKVADEMPDDSAIILTKIVERSPDEAAKWMVKALLSQSGQPDDGESPSLSAGPQIFDQRS